METDIFLRIQRDLDQLPQRRVDLLARMQKEEPVIKKQLSNWRAVSRVYSAILNVWCFISYILLFAYILALIIL